MPQITQTFQTPAAQFVGLDGNSGDTVLVAFNAGRPHRRPRGKWMAHSWSNLVFKRREFDDYRKVKRERPSGMGEL